MGERLSWPATTVLSLLAALTTWVSLFAWRGFVAVPSLYLIPALVGVLLVAVSGMLMRSARVPVLLIPLGQLALVVAWLSHRWAPAESWLGWIPTGDTIREIGFRIDAGATAAQEYAAPIPESAPQIHALLLVAGLGCALLVDFLACGLRRVPAAGLPLLAVYTTPISILDGGVPWWVFVAGALSFLFLLSAQETERLEHWGRPIADTRGLFDSLDTGVSARTMRAETRKIGITATGLAVLVPIFIPTFSGTLFPGSGPGSGSGGDAVNISNPLVDLRRDLTRGRDVDLVEVTTAEPDPSYLRISVLDTFDGQTWKPSERKIPVEQRAQGPLPPPSGVSSGTQTRRVDYAVQTTDLYTLQWLPAPFPVSAMQAPGDWRYDLGTMDFLSAAEGQTARGLDYTAEALVVEPTVEALTGARPPADPIAIPYTELPEAMPDIVARRAREVTVGAESDFAKAVRLQEWFRVDGGFTYSLEREDGNGTDDLVAFLSDTDGGRVGYCEQFAAAMAVMGRSVGIPSRVAVGFLRPQQTGSDTFVYSAHDLHAWPEMYFEGAGWIRFEPTPQDRASVVPPYTQAGLPGQEPTAAPSGAPSQAPDDPRQSDRGPDAGAAGAEGGGSGGGAGYLGAGLLVALALVVLAAAPRGARAFVRRRRWHTAASPADHAEAAWSELRDSARDLGLPWDDAVTLRRRARSLAASFAAAGSDDEQRRGGRPRTGAQANPEATAALERLVRWVERARYARTLDDVPDLAGDVAACVDALRRGVSRQRQLRADWLPASLWRGSRTEGRESGLRSGLPEPGIDRAI
jgi:transglutaminase-like putative cysteine protease